MTPAQHPSRGVRVTVIIAVALAVIGVAAGGLGGALVLLGVGLAVVALIAVVTGRRVLIVGDRGQGALAIVVATALVVGGGALLPEEDDGAEPGQEAWRTAGEQQPSQTPSPSLTPSPGPTPDPTPSTDPTPTTEPTPLPSPSEVSDEPTADNSALAAVAELDIKGRAPRTDYDRDAFEYREYDQDRNGCDVRNDVLRRDLGDLVIRPGSNGCVVEEGTLDDPYSGELIDFVRGVGTSNAVQIDHVVALSDAWQKGAQAWDAATMREFGNDPLNLLAVDGPLNSQKGAGDTATWLPPNRGYRCAYVARQVAVKAEYGLWVTQAEHDAMVGVLGSCPDEPLPQRETAPLMP